MGEKFVEGKFVLMRLPNASYAIFERQTYYEAVAQVANSLMPSTLRPL